MEDAARLALIEMNINNKSIFENLLKELLQLINLILENPHDYGFRKLKSDVLKPLLKYENFSSYLKYLGFELQTDEYVFPEEKTLSKLRAAQAAIENKMIYCYGKEKLDYILAVLLRHKKPRSFAPVNVLITDNQFLLTIQRLFNIVLRYEDKELLALAENCVPLKQLELRACERIRDFQRQIKTGAMTDEEMSYEMALLAELVLWFKHTFFKWMDKPPCEECGGATRLTGKAYGVVAGERCIVEQYRCTSCPGKASFPRHNDPRVLLKTRIGRCGEFANCFALLCRALRYDVRYVYDNTDHVWCEVYDFVTNNWIHVDPCEARVNAPLLYSHGWGKRISYVIAVSHEDVQDVTWRYTSRHKEVLLRRTLCTEGELLSAILQLRASRQTDIAPRRRTYLTERTLRELALLMIERKPEDYESQGRLSGELSWRQGRGEAVVNAKGYIFQLNKPGKHVIEYYTSKDYYKVSSQVPELCRVTPWSEGVFYSERILRKVETDWRQVYLAREEGADCGLISWKVASDEKFLSFQKLSIKAPIALFGTGQVEWTLQFDDHEPMAVEFGDDMVHYNRTFKSMVIAARLSDGDGSEAWQNAQLFRQSLDSDDPGFKIHILGVRDDDFGLD